MHHNVELSSLPPESNVWTNLQSPDLPPAQHKPPRDQRWRKPTPLPLMIDPFSWQLCRANIFRWLGCEIYFQHKQQHLHMLLAALLRDRDDAPVLVRATSYLPPTTDLIASRHVVVARQKLYTAPGSPVICRVPVRIFFGCWLRRNCWVPHELTLS